MALSRDFGMESGVLPGSSILACLFHFPPLSTFLFPIYFPSPPSSSTLIKQLSQSAPVSEILGGTSSWLLLKVKDWLTSSRVM